MSDVTVVKRGIPWVVAQFLLILVTVVAWFTGPRTQHLGMVGTVFVVAGVVLATWAVVSLAGGRSFTLYPRPREVGTLVTTGPFALVRHPIYTGALAINFGTSLVMSWTGVIPTVVLAVLWWCKSVREEQMLVSRFPDYPEYARRVRGRVIPGIF
jgi:protein-S-isoprenylcysteine O-methyltransferase Ste14